MRALLLALLLWVAGSAPCAAQAPASPEPPLLRRIPSLAEGMDTLPPFLRDTALNLHVRSFYMDRLNSNETANEAWAMGGWLAYKSGWLADTFAVGATGYTSQPLYAPASRDGTTLLAPGQESIVVLGELYAQLRFMEYALLTGYRQQVDDGYVNPQDNRMIPNTFEGVTLRGTLGPVGYNLGYLTAIKTRNSDEFVDMSTAAGATGKDRGLLLTRLSFAPAEGLAVYTANYLVLDVFNTVFGSVEYEYPIAGALRLKPGLQITDQRSVGSERLGDFSTQSVGGRLLVLWRGLSVGPGFNVTGDGAAVRTPYGTWPGFYSLLVRDFDRAGEKAWGVEFRYDFGGDLVPFKIPGLSLQLKFVEGRDARDPVKNVSLPIVREGNLDIIWNVAAVKGLSLRFRNGYVDEGGPRTLKDFRIIINYDLPLL